MAEQQYIGVKPLTMVRLVNGTMQYVYAGGVVTPEAVFPGEVDRLVAEGFLVQAGNPDAEMVVPGVLDTRGAITGPVAEDGIRPLGADPLGFLPGEPPPAPAGPPAPAAPVRPADDAAKHEWVAYAVSVRPPGQTEEEARAEAEKSTRDKLAARYPAAPAA